ncbi:hypothetical protein [Xanthomonas sacchari]|uniref:hypothetical protein n=1 Tax=Xanthomonas sacchari TaxID=56458 RepID=UPI00224D6587|nr:hypothetical protein [Xanthomonas sacchari]
MSLDYILLHGNLQASSIDELVDDDSFRLEDYQAVAQQIFPTAEWEDERMVADIGNRPPSRVRPGHALRAEVAVELSAFDGSLHLSCRGGGDIYHLAIRVAREARDLGLVTLDVQTSEIVNSESAEADPEYIEWYRHVLSKLGG